MDEMELIRFYLKLSRRQREVIELACEGWSNDQIGKRLYIASSVVAEHLSNVYGELGNAETYADRRVNRAVLISAFAPFFARRPELRNEFHVVNARR